MRWELAVPTRGSMDACLAALIPHAAAAPFPIRVNTCGTTPSTGLLRTLHHLGCPITVHTTSPGLSTSRLQLLHHAQQAGVDVQLQMDDDAALAQHPWQLVAGTLAANLTHHVRWATPTIRFWQGHHDPPPGHTEVWEQVAPDDPRLRAAVRARGWGWARTFDHGTPGPTNQLGGSCFAVHVPSIDQPTWQLLEETVGAMPPGAQSGEDLLLGAVLGDGWHLPHLHAYHHGTWSPQKWDAGQLEGLLLRYWPERAADLFRLLTSDRTERQ